MRRRNAWEALDSGVLLWRRNFFYFIPFFAMPVWIVAFALLFIPHEYRWISWLGLWWLKPLFDRFCLHVVASRFFDNSQAGRTASSSISAMLKNLPGNFFPGLIGDLLWRRFNPFRLSTMCLKLLERLKPRQYNERRNILQAGGFNFSAILSCLALPLEAVLLGGQFFFAYIMLDLVLPNNRIYFHLGPEIIMIATYTAFCINYILVESLFVCMGFGLYINCRTEIEGWDIQLQFKKFSEKLNPIIKIVILCTCFFFVIHSVQADEEYFPDSFMSGEAVPTEELREILSSDDFGGYRPSWRISLRNRNDDETSYEPVIDYRSWLRRLRVVAAFVLRALVIVILTGFVVFVLVRLYKLRQKLPQNKTANRMFFNLPVDNENPEVFFSRALDFYNNGQMREAWASCLCGYISAYNTRFGMVFPSNVTEYGCLEIVRNRFSEEGNIHHVQAFGNLIDNWVQLEYGGRYPENAGFNELIESGRVLINTEVNI